MCYYVLLSRDVAKNKRKKTSLRVRKIAGCNSQIREKELERKKSSLTCRSENSNKRQVTAAKVVLVSRMC